MYFVNTSNFCFTGSLRPLLVITNLVFTIEDDHFVLHATKIGSKLGGQKVHKSIAASDSNDACKSAPRIYAVNRQLQQRSLIIQGLQLQLKRLQRFLTFFQKETTLKTAALN